MSSGGGRKISELLPLIITAELDSASQVWLEGLRRAHYPPEKNRVPAHLTLFHALPGRARPEVAQRLSVMAAENAPLPARLAGWKSLGTGVAMRVDCPPLDALREDLAEALWLLLGAQDRAGVQLHVTVQNKVTAAAARATLAALENGHAALPASIVAFRLWRYLGGPWEAAGRWPLRGTVRGGLSRRGGLR